MEISDAKLDQLSSQLDRIKSIKNSTADQLDIAAIRKTLEPTNDASFTKSMVENFTDYCHIMASADVKATCSQQCSDHDIKWVYMSALADCADNYISDDPDWTGDLSEMRKIAKAWREEAKIFMAQ